MFYKNCGDNQNFSFHGLPHRFMSNIQTKENITFRGLSDSQKQEKIDRKLQIHSTQNLPEKAGTLNKKQQILQLLNLETPFKQKKSQMTEHKSQIEPNSLTPQILQMDKQWNMQSAAIIRNSIKSLNNSLNSTPNLNQLLNNNENQIPTIQLTTLSSFISQQNSGVIIQPNQVRLSQDPYPNPRHSSTDRLQQNLPQKHNQQDQNKYNSFNQNIQQRIIYPTEKPKYLHKHDISNFIQDSDVNDQNTNFNSERLNRNGSVNFNENTTKPQIASFGPFQNENSQSKFFTVIFGKMLQTNSLSSLQANKINSIPNININDTHSRFGSICAVEKSNHDQKTNEMPSQKGQNLISARDNEEQQQIQFNPPETSDLQNQGREQFKKNFGNIQISSTKPQLFDKIKRSNNQFIEFIKINQQIINRQLQDVKQLKQKIQEENENAYSLTQKPAQLRGIPRDINLSNSKIEDFQPYYQKNPGIIDDNKQKADPEPKKQYDQTEDYEIGLRRSTFKYNNGWDQRIQNEISIDGNVNKVENM